MLAKCLLSDPQVREVRLFYSYARRDALYRASIDDVLAAFQWDVAVRAWYDGEIRPGSEWEEQIHANLDAADIVLLFITQAFVDSPYCMQVEVPRALERYARRETRVIPIILEPTNPPLAALPISHLQVLPPGGVPLNQWPDRAQIVRQIVHALVNQITEPLLEASERTRWKLYLEGEYHRFSIRDEESVVRELRSLSQDSTLRTRAATVGGSIVMDMDSTRQGFATLRQWFEDAAGEARWIMEFPILRLIEWYGAGVHATTAIGMAPPPAPPDPASLQFPTSPGETTCIKGITINADDPLQSLDFIIDSGDIPGGEHPRRARTEDLLQDFLTCLATPESEMWVNLSPNDQAKLLGETLQGTELGRMMLEHDVLLKRLAASLLHPDHETGQRYWESVFTEAAKVTGHTRHAFDTHPRLWLVPEKAVVYERTSKEETSTPGALSPELPSWISDPLPPGRQQAFVIERAIKVMCEQDYFAAQTGPATPESPIAQICHDAFVEIVLPVVEHEVNHGRAFAAFRQFYATLILATWVKNKFHDNPVMQGYIDSRKPRQLQPTVTKTTPLHPHGQRIEKVGREPLWGGPDSAKECTEDDLVPLFEEGVRLRESGELTRSRDLLERVLELRLDRLGEEHNLTHVAMSQLGRTILALGEIERAEQLHRRVLERRRRILGQYHNWTINSMRILAATLAAANQYQEAQQLRADADAFGVMQTRECQDPDNRAFYEKYLDIYRNGVFFIQRHEFDASAGQRVTRAYFSGAIDMRNLYFILRCAPLEYGCQPPSCPPT